MPFSFDTAALRRRMGSAASLPDLLAAIDEAFPPAPGA